MSYLVENPENRFSRDTVLFIQTDFTNATICCKYTLIKRCELTKAGLLTCELDRPVDIIYTELKRKFTYTLFSKISANTFPLKNTFILN